MLTIILYPSLHAYPWRLKTSLQLRLYQPLSIIIPKTIENTEMQSNYENIYPRRGRDNVP